MRKIIQLAILLIFSIFIFRRKRFRSFFSEMFENSFEKIKFIIIELNAREN